MSTTVQQQRARSRLGKVGLCFGVFALLYGTSFYTRDWQSVATHADQTASEQRPVRTKVGPRTAEATLTQAPVWRDPEVTGSLPKDAEPVAAASQVKTITPPVAQAPRAAGAPSQSKAQTPASAQAQAQLAPPRARVQQKASKPTQVAAAPAERTPASPAAPSVAFPTPIQFQLAERGN